MNDAFFLILPSPYILHTHKHFSDLIKCAIEYGGTHAGTQAVDIMAWTWFPSAISIYTGAMLHPLYS